MRKRICGFLVLAILMLGLIGCGLKDSPEEVQDSTHIAYLKWDDGYQEIEISYYSIYYGRVNMIATDGTCYVTGAENVIIITPP